MPLVPPPALTHFTLLAAEYEYPVEFSLTHQGWTVLEYDYDEDGYQIIDSGTERAPAGSLGQEVKDYVATRNMALVEDVRGATPEAFAHWLWSLVPDHVVDAGLSVDGSRFEVDDDENLVEA